MKILKINIPISIYNLIIKPLTSIDSTKKSISLKKTQKKG
jgi:hypothetical protein